MTADELPRRVVARVHEYPEGNSQGGHAHVRAQLASPDRGNVTVATEDATWIVPAGWAVWLPSMVWHDIRSEAPLRLFSVYLEPEDATALPRASCLVTVPDLLARLIEHAVALPELYEQAQEQRLMAVLIDQIVAVPRAPLAVVRPRDKRLREIYDVLIRHPDDRRSLTAWAAELGMSERTLSRHFVTQTGVPFKTWRTQIRLIEALTRLASGVPVTTVAIDLGYGSMSAFSAVFRKYLGSTPSSYFKRTAPG